MKRVIEHVTNIDERAAVRIGASKGAIAEARAAINDIIGARIDNKTMRSALAALTTICEVKGATITNCNFEGVGSK